MDSESKQHVQLPNNMTENEKLSTKDLLIYVCIKRHMNNETKEAFPSLETIMEHASSSKPTVRKCIETLKELGYISVRKDGRKNIYKFNPHKNFEPFSYEFLDKKDLTSNEKAYIIGSQQYMFKYGGKGNVTFTDRKFADILNISPHSVAKYNKSLAEKNYLSIIETSKRDSETGLMINEKMFHLNELGQAIVFTLQKHNEDITELKEDSTSMKKQVEAMQKQIDILLNSNNKKDLIIEELKNKNIEEIKIVETWNQ